MDGSKDKKIGERKAFDIRKRAFDFAAKIIKFCQRFEQKGGVCRTISYQLLKAGTSVGANLEEAQAGQSKADFISKNSISLKEARESHYWLRLIIATNLMPETEVEELRDEAEELMKIIGSIVTSAKRNLDLD
jgi:four helix bundle protein